MSCLGLIKLLCVCKCAIDAITKDLQNLKHQHATGLGAGADYHRSIRSHTHTHSHTQAVRIHASVVVQDHDLMLVTHGSHGVHDMRTSSHDWISCSMFIHSHVCGLHVHLHEHYLAAHLHLTFACAGHAERVLHECVLCIQCMCAVNHKCALQACIQTCIHAPFCTSRFQRPPGVSCGEGVSAGPQGVDCLMLVASPGSGV